MEIYVFIGALVFMGLIAFIIIITRSKQSCSDGVHNYEAQYDKTETEPTVSLEKSPELVRVASKYEGYEVADIINSSKGGSRKYVCSVCKGCGKVVSIEDIDR